MHLSAISCRPRTSRLGSIAVTWSACFAILVRLSSHLHVSLLLSAAMLAKHSLVWSSHLGNGFPGRMGARVLRTARGGISLGAVRQI